MDQVLWGLQLVLSVTFVGAGVAKLIQPADKVRQLVPESFPLLFVRLLGGLEILGAAGLILPELTSRLFILTPITAVCMGLVLIGAAFVHYRQRDYAKLPFLAVLLLIAAGVAYFRFTRL